MQMQRPYSNRASLVTGAFCLMLAGFLAGCASKNPLMEDPAPVAAAAREARASAPVAPAEPAAAAVEEKSNLVSAYPAAPAEAPATAAAPQAAPAAAVSAEKPDAAAPAAPSPASAPAAEAQAGVPPVAAEAATPAAATAAPAAASGVQTVRKKNFLGIFTPYRPDIQQGNFVSREMVAQLKEGMTPAQVTFLLGTPLLRDIFHAERWDYAFRMQKGNGDVTTSRVTVFFKDGLVSHFEGGGDLPTEADYLARIADKAKKANK